MGHIIVADYGARPPRPSLSCLKLDPHQMLFQPLGQSSSQHYKGQVAWITRLVEFSITHITLTTTNTAPIVPMVMVAQSARYPRGRKKRTFSRRRGHSPCSRFRGG